ncbi:MAG TPA: NlpC/P60 family protein [Gaiellaceae bacterium]|nr:NlpC/P60 family protein [Gaiellaceae bacterium]
MGQLQQLSDSLERARSQYDTATSQLAQIQRDLHENRFELHVAKRNLQESQRTIASRLVTLYTTEQTSTLEVILGARSLDDMINRMDGVKSVTALDANILSQVETFRAAVKRHGALLARARAAQTQVVAQRAAAKQSLESKIGEQNRLLASIKGQISQIVAADAARQLQMAREAQARLSLQRQNAVQQQQNTVVGASAIAPSADTIVAPPPTHSAVVGIALSQLGTPYVWAGAAPGGFDCSGLVMWAYAQVGVSLPHSSYAMYGYGVPVSKDQLAPGDLVFFDGLGHVGLYIGGGQFVDAPHAGAVVQIASLNDGWYAASYVGARRIL